MQYETIQPSSAFELDTVDLPRLEHREQPMKSLLLPLLGHRLVLTFWWRKLPHEGQAWGHSIAHNPDEPGRREGVMRNSVL